jgi:hypothetical protein
MISLRVEPVQPQQDATEVEGSLAGEKNSGVMEWWSVEVKKRRMRTAECGGSPRKDAEEFGKGGLPRRVFLPTMVEHVFDRHDVMDINLLCKTVLVHDDDHVAAHGDEIWMRHLDLATIRQPQQEGINSLG